MIPKRVSSSRCTLDNAQKDGEAILSAFALHFGVFSLLSHSHITYPAARNFASLDTLPGRFSADAQLHLPCSQVKPVGAMDVCAADLAGFHAQFHQTKG